MASSGGDLDDRKQAVASVVARLAAKDYSGIEQLTRGVRLSAGELRTAVEQYGRTVVPLPSEGLNLIEYIEIAGSSQGEWSVIAPQYAVEVDNLNVL